LFPPASSKYPSLAPATATAKILLILVEEIKNKKKELIKSIENAQNDKLKSFEAAEYLSVPKEKIYELAKNGTLKITETYTTKNGYEGFLFLRKDVEKLVIEN